MIQSNTEGVPLIGLSTRVFQMLELWLTCDTVSHTSYKGMLMVHQLCKPLHSFELVTLKFPHIRYALMVQITQLYVLANSIILLAGVLLANIWEIKIW